MVDKEAGEALLKSSTMSIDLNDRQSCDVELLMNGGFSPLNGFMNEDVYTNVVLENRLLGSNLLFGLPVVLDTNQDIPAGTRVTLNYQGKPMAVLDVESSYKPNKPLEVKNCYLTSSLEHPGVQMVAMERGNTYVGGKISGIELPKRVFPCETPEQVRSGLPANTDVVAFQCRNPIHRAHYELFTRALDAENVATDGVVLVHPTCGPTQADDIPGEVRHKTYVVLKEETANPRVNWAYLPYSMHMAGPREAVHPPPVTSWCFPPEQRVFCE
jgi:sulfate adenylyltransferase